MAGEFTGASIPNGATLTVVTYGWVGNVISINKDQPPREEVLMPDLSTEGPVPKAYPPYYDAGRLNVEGYFYAGLIAVATNLETALKAVTATNAVLSFDPRGVETVGGILTIPVVMLSFSWRAAMSEAMRYTAILSVTALEVATPGHT